MGQSVGLRRPLVLRLYVPITQDYSDLCRDYAGATMELNCRAGLCSPARTFHRHDLHRLPMGLLHVGGRFGFITCFITGLCGTTIGSQIGPCRPYLLFTVTSSPKASLQTRTSSYAGSVLHINQTCRSSWSMRRTLGLCLGAMLQRSKALTPCLSTGRSGNLPCLVELCRIGLLAYLLGTCPYETRPVDS